MQFFAFARSAFAIALDEASADSIVTNIRDRFIYFSKVNYCVQFYRVSHVFMHGGLFPQRVNKCCG